MFQMELCACKHLVYASMVRDQGSRCFYVSNVEVLKMEEENL